MRKKSKVVIGGTGVDPGGCPCPSCMPLTASDEDEGLADGAAVDS